MNRILTGCLIIAVLATGCHTTEAFAIRSPRAEVAPSAPCIQQCEKVKALDPDDTEAFLRCLAVCPDTTVSPNECRELATTPETKCVDQEVRKAAVGRTIGLVFAIIGSVIVAGAAASSAAGGP